MISIAIAVLWFLIGFIVICGVIWLAIYVIELMTGRAIPERVKQGVWLIVLLLAIIALLTAVLGGGGSVRMPSFR